MGDICDACSENRVNEYQRDEYNQEILTSKRPNRALAIKNICESIDTSQRKKTTYRSDHIWNDNEDEDDIDDALKKNKLHFIMYINQQQQNSKDEDTDDNGNGYNRRLNNSFNLDDKGYTKSKMIPFLNNDINNLNGNVGLGGGSGGGGGGFVLPLQRYQYEDLDLDNKIAEKKIKKLLNYSNSAQKNKKNNTKKKIQSKGNKKNNNNNDEDNNENDINYIASLQKQAKDHLIIFLTYPGTQIDKSLFKNPKELLISFDKINRLDPLGVVFDGDIVKMSYQRSGCKMAPKYLQITKDSFKYFNSISSQQVYKNKPLLQIAILDIEKIEITNDLLIKLRRSSVQFAFKIILDNNQSYDFGCDDPDYGANIISILTILKKYAYQRAFECNKNEAEAKAESGADFKMEFDNIN